MKHICCYSGGHDSALVAVEVCRRFGAANTILLNHDISAIVEGTDIKRFKQEVAAYLGLSITYANAPDWENKTQFDVVIEAGAFRVGNGTALCTNRMKTRPFEAWLEDTVKDKSSVVIYYGFSGNEKDRIQRRSSHLALLGFKTDYPLALWQPEERTLAAIEDIGIARPNTYSVFKHGNCVGCLKAGKQHWYVVFCTRPDIWELGKRAEEEIGYSIIKGIYLEDLEPLFTKMQATGIEATEHVPFQTFWANVRKRLHVCALDVEDELPCECLT